MSIMFNTILREAGLRLTDVRLIRHKDQRAARDRTPYELWRDNRSEFELYQSIQSIPNRKKLTAPYWAVFIVSLSSETMFAGVYAVKYRGLLDQDRPSPHMDGVDEGRKLRCLRPIVAADAERPNREAIHRLGQGGPCMGAIR